MNQVATTRPQDGTDSFVHRFEGLRGRLPGDPAVREAARAAFLRSGLPGRHDEAWHYTSLRALADARFQEPLSVVASAPALGDELPDLPRLVLIDGRYQPDLSTWPAGVGVSCFAENPDLSIESDLPMVALNSMLVEDGVQIDVPAGLDAGALVLLSLVPEGHRPIDVHPRHRIRLAEGARLTVIEISRGEGTYLRNTAMQVSVAAGATLSHVRLQQEAPESFSIATTLADVAARGTYDFFVLGQGARLSRTEVHATLAGPNAWVHLNGAQMLTGSQHGDITTVVRHAAPGCSSRQTIKNVLEGRARGVFQGRIEVARVAQKTDGYQMNQALLLSPTAEIDCKPQLEIYADDVKCSHGATVGELDADQLFYLRSRGVPAAEARAILVRAFLTEALDGVQDPVARTLLERAIEGWWERHPA